MRVPSGFLRRLFPAGVLLLATGMLAQKVPASAAPGESSPQTGNSPAASGSTSAAPANAAPHTLPAGSITLQGCVNGGKQGYTLLQESTGASFELESRSYLLKHARGKQVQVTGREMPPDAKSHGMPRLDLEGMQVLSDHCALPGKASGASTNVPEPNSNGNAAQPSVATPKYQPPGAPDQTPPSQGNNPTNWGRTSGPPSPGTGNPPPPKP